MGRTKKTIKFKIPEKPRKIKGFRSGGYRIATTISSADPSTTWVSLHIEFWSKMTRKKPSKKGGEERKITKLFQNDLRHKASKRLVPKEKRILKTPTLLAISSQPRYDHFDTSPCMFTGFSAPNHGKNSAWLWTELPDRTANYSVIRTQEKCLFARVFGYLKRPMGQTISSQGRYDHFDTCPYAFLLRGLLTIRAAGPFGAASPATGTHYTGTKPSRQEVIEVCLPVSRPFVACH